MLQACITLSYYQSQEADRIAVNRSECGRAVMPGSIGQQVKIQYPLENRHDRVCYQCLRRFRVFDE